MNDLLISTNNGLYCPDGDFYIDPWKPVPAAIITHAHADHASPGSQDYLTARPGAGVLQARLGPEATIQAVEYGERIHRGSVQVSLHPAGHILGSAQVRLEKEGQVWVVTGDFKTAADRTCAPFEPLACHTLITESTFGLPIYRWQSAEVTFDEINAWWASNVRAGIASIVFAYSLGKAQRLITGLDRSLGPIYCHGAVEKMNEVYRAAGVSLPETIYTGEKEKAAKRTYAGAIIVAPPSARGSRWLRRFGEVSSAYVSGWMHIRGARRRRAVDRGFTLSDHADWPAIVQTVRDCGASRVLVTHGFVDPLVRWLNENGWQAAPLHTEFLGELDENSEPAAADAPAGGSP